MWGTPGCYERNNFILKRDVDGSWIFLYHQNGLINDRNDFLGTIDMFVLSNVFYVENVQAKVSSR